MAVHVPDSDYDERLKRHLRIASGPCPVGAYTRPKPPQLAPIMVTRCVELGRGVGEKNVISR